MPIIKTSGWYASNLQKGNLSKYQTMSLIHNSTVSDIPLHFQGNTIESSGSLKLSGVTIDEQLNFNIHINEICKRASQRVGVMMRLKKLIPTNAKLTLYKSAILLYLKYNLLPLSDLAPQLAPCKGIHDSLGFWIPHCRFRILTTGFRI